MNQQFQVRWPNGQTTVEVSHNSETPTAYAMERWGCNSLEDLAALGVDIKMPSTEHEQIEETEMKGESAQQDAAVENAPETETNADNSAAG